MRGDCIGSQKFAQMMGHTFGHPSRVYENERGPMLLNQLGQPRINFLPNFVRHHRLERRFRDLDPEIKLALMSDVDDSAVWISVFVNVARSNQKTRNVFDWFLSGGKPDALQRFFSQC